MTIKQKKIEYVETKLGKKERVYFNIDLSNPINSGTEVEASFNQPFNQIILEKANRYKMTIARLSIPGNSVPMIIGTQDLYSVTLSYNGTNEQVFLDMVDGEVIRTINSIVRRTNEALNQAFLNLKVSEPTMPADFPPMFIYDHSIRQLIIYFQYKYNETLLGATPVEVWVNDPLLHLYGAIKYEGVNIPELSGGRAGLIRVVDAGDYNRVANFTFPLKYSAGSLISNPFSGGSSVKTDALVIPQTQGDVLNCVSQLIGFVIKSNSFGNRREIQNVASSFDSDFFSDPNYKQEEVIFDLIVNQPGNSITDTFVYTPNLYRWIDITSQTSLHRMNFSVFYKFKSGDIYPVIIEGGRILDIKFLFETVENECYEHY